MRVRLDLTSQYRQLPVVFGALKPEAKAKAEQFQQEASDRLHYKHYPHDVVDYHVSLLLDANVPVDQAVASKKKLLESVGQNPYAAHNLLDLFAEKIQNGSVSDPQHIPKELLLDLVQVIKKAPQGLEIFINKPGLKPGISHFEPMFGPEVDAAFLKMVFHRAKDFRIAQTAEPEAETLESETLSPRPLNERFLFDALRFLLEEDGNQDADAIQEITRRILAAARPSRKPDFPMLDKEGLRNVMAGVDVPMLSASAQQPGNLGAPVAEDLVFTKENPYERAMEGLNYMRALLTKAEPPRTLLEGLLKLVESSTPSAHYRGETLTHLESTFPADLEKKYLTVILNYPAHPDSERLWIRILDNLFQRHGEAIEETSHASHMLYAMTRFRLIQDVKRPVGGGPETLEQTLVRQRKSARNVLVMMADETLMKSEPPEDLVEELLAIANHDAPDEPAVNHASMLRLSQLSKLSEADELPPLLPNGESDPESPKLPVLNFVESAQRWISNLPLIKKFRKGK